MADRSHAGQDAGLTVEEGPFRQFTCPCCGHLENMANGFVHGSKGQVAGYRAAWTAGDGERVVMLAIGVGPWGDGSSFNERRTLVAQLRHAGTRVAMSAMDAADFGFYPEELGRPLSRDEALERPDIDHLWAVADAIVEHDTRVDGACHWMRDGESEPDDLALDDVDGIDEPAPVPLGVSFPYGEM